MGQSGLPKPESASESQIKGELPMSESAPAPGPKLKPSELARMFRMEHAALIMLECLGPQLEASSLNPREQATLNAGYSIFLHVDEGSRMVTCACEHLNAGKDEADQTRRLIEVMSNMVLLGIRIGIKAGSMESLMPDRVDYSARIPNQVVN